MGVRVFVYGVPARLHGQSVVLPAAVDEQLRLAHGLREDLVTLWQQRQDALGAIWSADPRIAAVEQQITTAETETAEVAARAAKERCAARARGATASSPRLTELRAQIRQARARRRELISEVRADRKDDLAQIETGHRAAVKTTYRQHCQEGDLYWATYNDVAAHHKTAAAQVAKTRAAGQVSQLRHHRFDGSGSIAVQLQRQAGAPPRTPATIADGQRGRWRNVLHLTPWIPPEQWAGLTRSQQHRRRVGHARLGVGAGCTITVPVLVHRMLPVDAEITGARLVVRRVAGQRRAELHVTVTLPDPPQVDAGPAVAVHLGWRHDADRGTVRVATWRATTPITIPADLDARITPGAPVVSDTATTGQIVITRHWRQRVDAHDAIQTDRDIALDKIRAQLADWLQRHGPFQHGDREITAADVTRWRAPGRFARLALDWHRQPPPGPGGAEIAAELESWRRADKLGWEGQAHGRAGALAARDDSYRRIAAWIARLAGKLVVDDTNVAAIARRADPAAEPHLPTALERRAARHRTLVAPGRLREILTATATRDGVPVVTVPHTGTTRTHYRCGHHNPTDDRYAAGRTVPCDGCGQTYDQDASATLMLLAASADAPPPGQTTPRNHT